MEFIKGFFNTKIGRRGYLRGIIIICLSQIFINLPIAVMLMERFTRPTYTAMTVTYILLPLLLLLIFVLQIVYFFSLNSRRKHDLMDSGGEKKHDLYIWDYFLRAGNKSQ